MRANLPRLLAMAVFGAAIGPVALAWGLQRTTASGLNSWQNRRLAANSHLRFRTAP